MIDKADFALPKDNLRTLFSLLSDQLDQRVMNLRVGTEFAGVRVSDVRTFIYASAGGVSISELSTALGITRQAVHSSLKRLIDVGVVSLVPAAHSRRDMVVTVTERGAQGRQEVKAVIHKFESEMAEVIGRDGVETLRTMIKAILHNSHAKNIAASLGVTQSA